MGSPLSYAVNCALSWLIVALSVVGYLLTVKRMKEKWPLWFVLGAGWMMLALPNTLLLTGATLVRRQLQVVWFSSYVLVAASLLLLLVKAIQIFRRRKLQSE